MVLKAKGQKKQFTKKIKTNANLHLARYIKQICGKFNKKLLKNTNTVGEFYIYL